MNIHESTSSYEKWIGKSIQLNFPDLRYKHQQMKVSPFLFLRATFYRWAQAFPAVCPGASRAVHVLGVGDLHVENFGTWRDEDGRLVWGVNDFDEACELPYTNDLVRLSASAIFAIQEAGWKLTPQKVCDLVLEGYTRRLKEGGEPFVLEEHHKTLRTMAMSALRRPPVFWENLKAKLVPARSLPRRASKALEPLMPEGAEPQCFMLKKPKGLGSLGHRRYIALAEWQGGLIARETKELGPSAWFWARGLKRHPGLQVERVLKQAVRCRDPFMHVRKGWTARRLAPHCFRIDLDTLDDEHDELCLLSSMGAETANIHCGDPKKIKLIRRDLAGRSATWLYEAAAGMVASVSKDWTQFRKR